MTREELTPGLMVRHFKRETLTGYDLKTFKYVYQIVGIATHSESNEELVVYQSCDTSHICVRPLDMFLSKVDKEKYPDIKQEYRFEKVFSDPTEYIDCILNRVNSI